MRLYTWEITLSTVEDIDQHVARDIAAYFKKKCRYGYVVLEQSSKWHLHAVVCFKTAMEKKHFEETIWLKTEKAHPTSIKRRALKSVVQYDHDWYDTYLRKSDGVQVLWDSYDREEVGKFFPSAEEQADLMLAVATKTPAVGDAKDPRYARMEQAWIEYSQEVTYESALKYLKYAMNVERSMAVIADKRRLCQTAFALYEYRSHAVEPVAEEIRFGNQLIGNCL